VVADDLARMKRSQIKLPWFAMASVAAVLSVGLYFLRFGPGSRGLSGDTEDWARFGEYAGGVLGIFAFIGVLVTIHLQRLQLDQLSEQLRQATNKGTVDELMQLCRVIVGNIDEVLDRPQQFSDAQRNLLDWAHCPGTIRGVVRMITSDNPSVRANAEPQVWRNGPKA
jgi:hypothetical protein